MCSHVNRAYYICINTEMQVACVLSLSALMTSVCLWVSGNISRFERFWSGASECDLH